jgi:serine/threonine protein kinase
LFVGITWLGLKVDLWAMGAIIYLLLGGYPAFFDEEENEAVITKKILTANFDFNPAFWGHVSKEAKELIRGQCMTEFLVIGDCFTVYCNDFNGQGC